VNCRVLNWPESWLHPIQNLLSSWAMWSQNLWPSVVSLAFAGHFSELPNLPKANPYEIMVTDGRVHDIDQDDLDRWYVPSVQRLNPNIVHDFVQLYPRCEYIFYRGLYRTSYARISRGIITDTEMQIGQFVLPRHGTPIVDESVSARYSRAFKEQMPIEYVRESLLLLFPAFLLNRNEVVAYGVLWRSRPWRCERSLLSCLWHSKEPLSSASRLDSILPSPYTIFYH